MATTRCRFCGVEIEYDDLNIPYRILPTVCDPCYAEATKKPPVKVVRWTDGLPYDAWDQELGNKAVLNRIGAVAFKDKAPAYGLLYVVGGVRTGKTVSLCELARTAEIRGFGGRYVSCPDLLDGYSRALGDDGDGSAYANRYANEPGVLIVDDLGVGRLTERGIELLYRVFNKRMETKESSTWITSNWTIDQVGEWIMRASREEITAQRIARRLAERAVVVQL
jgi:DNA replication protein DnaC